MEQNDTKADVLTDNFVDVQDDKAIPVVPFSMHPSKTTSCASLPMNASRVSWIVLDLRRVR